MRRDPQQHEVLLQFVDTLYGSEPACRVAPHLSAQASATTYLRPNQLCILEVQRLHEGNVSGSGSVCTYQFRAVPSCLLKSSLETVGPVRVCALARRSKGPETCTPVPSAAKRWEFRGQRAAYHITAHRDLVRLGYSQQSCELSLVALLSTLSFSLYLPRSFARSPLAPFPPPSLWADCCSARLSASRWRLLSRRWASKCHSTALISFIQPGRGVCAEVSWGRVRVRHGAEFGRARS